MARKMNDSKYTDMFCSAGHLSAAADSGYFVMFSFLLKKTSIGSFPHFVHKGPITDAEFYHLNPDDSN